MALDGLVMANLASDLRNKLIDGRINKIYQPEADELLLIIKNQKNTYRLLLSAQASLPLMYFTDENKTNPLTAPNFCMLLRKHINNGKIVAIVQPNFERIIEISIEHLNDLGDLCRKKLIIEIMGRHSNIIFCDDTNKILDSIKHISQNISSVREVLPGRIYSYPPDQGKLNPLTVVEDQFKTFITSKETPVYKALYTTLTGISPLIAQELCYRSQVDGSKHTSELKENEIDALFLTLKALNKLIDGQAFIPTIVYKEGIPEEFSSIPLTSYSTDACQSFSSISEVLKTFYETKSLLTRIRQKSSDIRRVVQTALERSYKKYDLQANQLKDTGKKEKYKLYGELILANVYNIKEGMTSLHALDYYTNNEITIPLDPTLNGNQNSQKYYARYNKLKRTFEALQSQIEETKKEISHLESIANALDMADSDDDLTYIRKELVEWGYIRKRLKDKKNNHVPSEPLHFISSDGFHIYVGKNNFQNDDLSFKFANNSDWWFHTKEIPGSHVIVKSDQGELTDKTFEEAAAVAAYFSKARTSTKVAVDYTLKKNLKKPNGAKPGFVIYHTNYSVFVDPSLDGVTQV